MRKKDNWNGIDLERISIDNYLGRLISCQVVDKGYLFPLGHRASFVKETIRSFFAHPETAEPVAYDVQHYYIEVDKPDKAYPAPEQPFGGRLFPDVSKITMRTRRTPYLWLPVNDPIDPSAPDGDNDGGIGVTVGAGSATDTYAPAFWPKTSQKAGTEFRFEWLINDEAGIVRSPLMFVSNRAAHDTDAVHAVMGFYAADGKWASAKSLIDRLRTAEFSGGTHRYAPTSTTSVSGNQGKTSFQTIRWRMGACGRLGPDASDKAIANLQSILPTGVFCENYVTTNGMEGADQPPFYPVLAEADTVIQSIDRMVGHALGPITVGPNFTYVNAGFDPAGNPGEIYLDVLRPQPHVTFASAGGSSGGIAHPDFILVALSRQIGPVGGQQGFRTTPPTMMARIGARLGLVDEPPADPARTPPTGALAGLLDPTEFLVGKLLGAVPMAKIVKPALLKNAPKIVESTQFASAADSIEQAVEKTKEMVQTVAAKIEGFIAQIRTACDASGVPWKTLYPVLATRLDDAETAMGSAVQAAATASDAIALFEAVTKAANALTALADELEATVQHPTPAILTDFISTLNDAIALARQWLSDDPLKALGRYFVDALTGSGVTAGLGRDGALLFGLPNQTGTVEGLVTSVDQSPFAAQLAMPLAKLLSAVDQIEAAATDQIAGAVAALVSRAIEFAASNDLFVRAERELSAATDHCKYVSAALREWCIGVPASVDALGANLVAIETALGKCAPTALPPAFADRVAQAQRAALQALQASATSLQDAADLFRKAGADQCDVTSLTAPTNLLRWRALALAHLADLCRAVATLSAVIAEAPQDLKDAALGQLKATLKPMVDLLTGNSSAASASSGALSALPHLSTLRAQWRSVGLTDLDDQVTQLISDAVLTAQALTKNLADAQADMSKNLDAIAVAVPGRTSADLQPLATLAAQAVRYAEDYDRKLAGLIALGIQVSVSTVTELDKWGSTVLVNAAQGALALHVQLSAALDKILQPVSQPGSPIAAVLEPTLLTDLQGLKKGVDLDRAALANIVAGAAAPDLSSHAAGYKAATDLAARWAAAKPPFVAASDRIAALVQAVATGHFATLLNLGGLPDLLREQIAAFVPTAVDLSYGFDTNLDDFPAGDPIFSMADDALEPHLSLKMNARFDLLHPERRSFSGTGVLQRFIIHILGDLQLVDIYFAPMTFTLGPSGPNFDVKIEKVEIKEGLQFIQQLEDFLGGNSPTGPYIDITPPLIEAGFRFSTDTITVGPMLFQNVALGVSAQLMLDGREARFLFNVATTERPLTISYGPYGGAGHVKLVANARGITGVEASLEFGATVAISFGPLNASGRVMAGIYMSQSQEYGAVISGFIHAVGEGSIACFGISVNIEVRITHDSCTGTMTGNSTFSFSFRVGFVSLSYSFTASYQVHGSAPSQPPSHTCGKAGPAALVARARASSLVVLDRPWVAAVTIAPRKDRNWGDYKRRFDLSLLKDAA